MWALAILLLVAPLQVSSHFRLFLNIFCNEKFQVILADVVTLTNDNFAQHVNGESNILVEFYAPW